MKKKICTACGNDVFETSAMVKEIWIVDSYGLYIGTNEEEETVLSFPDDTNIWKCTRCGKEAYGWQFEAGE